MPSKGSRSHHNSFGAGHGGPARPPDHMDRYLREFQYPARKRYLIDQARIQEVPSDVVHVLRRLPDREYLDAEQVAQTAREQA